MELQTRGRYAVMALAELAREPAAASVSLPQLAERQNLPLAYLEQIFVALRRAGLVESARGRSGGYKLTRASSEISISAVMAAVDEEPRFTRCSTSDPRCHKDQPCITHGLWTALGEVTTRFLQQVSLADVVASDFSGAMSGNGIAVDAVKPAVAATTRVYLDYNATAPLRDEARSAIDAAFAVVGNASSVHAEGRKARSLVEEAREKIARLVGAKPSEIVFTSGATESNAWAMAQPCDVIALSAVEHDSVRAPVEARSNIGAVRIAVDAEGVVDFEALSEALARASGKRTWLAVQMANNETGVIQPVADIARIAREAGALVHCDAVQAVGRLPIDFATLGLDTMAISAHKLAGPKGIGALVIRDHLDLVPLIRGGGQERRRRAGTENVAAIAGFGAAAEAARTQLEKFGRLAGLRDRLEAGIRAITPEAVIVGASAPRVSNTSCFALPGKLAETLVIRFDLAGIAVSAGAACSSGKVGSSHVLEAMGLPRQIAAGAIRVSLAPATGESDITRFLEAWEQIAAGKMLAA